MTGCGDGSKGFGVSASGGGASVSGVGVTTGGGSGVIVFCTGIDFGVGGTGFTGSGLGGSGSEMGGGGSGVTNSIVSGGVISGSDCVSNPGRKPIAPLCKPIESSSAMSIKLSLRWVFSIKDSVAYDMLVKERQSDKL
jgi:hypothetical protein